MAPFEKQSGTSLKMKSRVSHFANNKMKSLLNLSASSATQADPELKAYYLRRVENGKSKI
ncbi:MAG: IS110 family transposase [Cytophagales bacterium]|nr:IS110 family transposase [Cytophagales bacterium]